MKRTIAVLALLAALCASVSAQDKDKTGKIKIEDDQNYLVLSTKRIQTMEKELGWSRDVLFGALIVVLLVGVIFALGVASIVGASRQQVTEYLNEFDREKIILREGRRIIINPKSLRKIIESRP